MGSDVVAAFWHPEGDGVVACELCPNECRLVEGRSGICKVRRNVEGKLGLPYYGLVSSVAIDPIEKKPLYHFLPGSSVFSIGFVGCNLRCPFCQNWRISQEIPPELEEFTPEALVAAALRSNAPSIAYTYSEPCVHFEFVRSCMAKAREKGLRNVLVTNGCLKPEPARQLLSLCDATNVDLKVWSSDAYYEKLGGDRDAVLEFLRIAAKTCHLEVTTLVVPRFSDSPECVDSIALFLASLSPSIPLHLSAYHPAWKHREAPTDGTCLERLAELARGKLRYVYIGNLAGSPSDSYCPSCGARLISRRGYMIEIESMKKRAGRAICSACDSDLDIIV